MDNPFVIPKPAAFNVDKLEDCLRRLLNYQLDSKGDLWTIVKGSDSKLTIFLETLRLQTLKHVRWARDEVRKLDLECQCTPRDYKMIREYDAADERAKFGVRLSKRAIQYRKKLTNLMEENDRRVNFLLLLAPHGF